MRVAWSRLTLHNTCRRSRMRGREAYCKSDVQMRRGSPCDPCPRAPVEQKRGKFVVGGYHEDVPLQYASLMEYGTENGLVQFPLVVAVERAAEGVRYIVVYS